MITALFRLLNLFSRWSSDHRPEPWTQHTSYTDEPFTDEPASWVDAPTPHDASTGGPRRLRSSPVPYPRALRSDTGMTTAEYAVGTVAAVAFAVVLFRVVQSPAVHSALAAVVVGALNVHL